MRCSIRWITSSVSGALMIVYNPLFKELSTSTSTLPNTSLTSTLEMLLSSL